MKSPEVKIKFSLFLRMSIVHLFLYSFPDCRQERGYLFMKFINKIGLLPSRMSQSEITRKIEESSTNGGEDGELGSSVGKVIELRKSGS